MCAGRNQENYYLRITHLYGLVSVTAFGPLLFASGLSIFETNGLRGVVQGVILMLIAQGTLWMGAEFSPVRPGKLGLWRAVAMTLFITQTLSIPFTLFHFVWREVGNVADDELGVMTIYQLTWALLSGLSAATFCALSKVRWWRHIADPSRED